MPSLSRGHQNIPQTDSAVYITVMPQKMPIEATSKTAAIAGVWSVFRFVPFDAWLDQHKAIFTLLHNVTFLPGWPPKISLRFRRQPGSEIFLQKVLLAPVC
jgi:hypothetical protein